VESLLDDSADPHQRPPLVLPAVLHRSGPQQDLQLRFLPGTHVRAAARPLGQQPSVPPSRRARRYRLTAWRLTPSTSATLLCRMPCSNKSAACNHRQLASTRFNRLPVPTHLLCRRYVNQGLKDQ
jgi:hypothetical protein